MGPHVLVTVHEPSTQSYSAAHTLSSQLPPRPAGHPSAGISPQSLMLSESEPHPASATAAPRAAASARPDRLERRELLVLVCIRYTAPMRPCATVNAVAIGLAFVGLTFVACSGGSPPAQPPAAATVPTESQGPVSTAPAVDMPTAAESKELPKPRAKPPSSVADCKEMLSEITNEAPDGGVVMNNAMTAADAGASDRLQPMIDLMKAKRDAFRCCFDLWGQKNRGAEGSITFVINLKPDGALKEAHVDQERSKIRAPEVDSCMVDLAKTLTYPKSPSGKETSYTHRFDFKARN